MKAIFFVRVTSNNLHIVQEILEENETYKSALMQDEKPNISQLLRLLEPEVYSWIILDDLNPIGYAVLIHTYTYDEIGCTIRYQFRNMGYGAHIIERLINICRQLSDNPIIRLRTLSTNIPMRKIAERFGFNILQKERMINSNKEIITYQLEGCSNGKK